jgi:ubiquinone/menaquinone biosynthesis C-methylase UbiE
MKVYDDMANYYDLIYNDRLDAEFYAKEAKNTRGPILEVACGTGRIFLDLLASGMEVWGIDISKSMLDILKEKARKKNLVPNVFHANMLDFKLDKKFKLIIVPYRSFLHLSNENERKQALINFRNHLYKNGRLILHTYVPSEDEYGMTGKLHKFYAENLKTQEGRQYAVDWYLRYDQKTKTGHYEINLAIDGKTHLFAMDIAYLGKDDVANLLKSCGYKNIKCYCGFNYMPFNNNCREAIWIADC